MQHKMLTKKTLKCFFENPNFHSMIVLHADTIAFCFCLHLDQTWRWSFFA